MPEELAVGGRVTDAKQGVHEHNTGQGSGTHEPCRRPLSEQGASSAQDGEHHERRF